MEDCGFCTRVSTGGDIYIFGKQQSCLARTHARSLARTLARSHFAEVGDVSAFAMMVTALNSNAAKHQVTSVTKNYPEVGKAITHLKFQTSICRAFAEHLPSICFADTSRYFCLSIS